MQNESQIHLDHILFVTGQLAESAVQLCKTVADKVGFDYSIVVLPITVAAHNDSQMVAAQVASAANVTRVIVPGYLESGMMNLRTSLGLPVDCGRATFAIWPNSLEKTRN